MSEKKIVNTPDGMLYVASNSRVIAAVLVDLLVPAITIMCALAFLEQFWTMLPQWWSPTLGVLVFLYVFLARRTLIFSFGNWGLGLRRYSYTSIEEFSGSGALFAIEKLPNSTLSQRTVVLAAYLGVMFFMLWLLGTY